LQGRMQQQLFAQQTLLKPEQKPQQPHL
jgi:hypothetical protein